MITLYFDFVFLAERAGYRLISTGGWVLFVFKSVSMVVKNKVSAEVFSLSDAHRLPDGYKKPVGCHSLK